MPNTTLAANAQTMPIDRRAALGALAGGALLAAPLIAKAEQSPSGAEFAALIEAHREAREAFEVAAGDLEAAWPDKNADVVGIGGARYNLKNDRARIARGIDDHAERLSLMAKTLAAVSPAVGAEALAILERERSAARGRLDSAFAHMDAAQARYDEKRRGEDEALFAICAYRCASLAEIERKFRYLARFKDELLGEQTDAIFASLAPEGEA